MPISSPNCIALVFSISSEIGIFCALALVNHINKADSISAYCALRWRFLGGTFSLSSFSNWFDLSKTSPTVRRLTSMFQRVVKWFANSCWLDFGCYLEYCTTSCFFFVIQICTLSLTRRFHYWLQIWNRLLCEIKTQRHICLIWVLFNNYF